VIRAQIRLPAVLRRARFWLRLAFGPTRPAFVAVLDRMIAADNEYRAAAETLHEALTQIAATVSPAGKNTSATAGAFRIFHDKIDVLVRASERMRDAILAHAAIILAVAQDHDTIAAWDRLKAAADAQTATDRRLREFTLDGREAAMRTWGDSWVDYQHARWVADVAFRREFGLGIHPKVQQGYQKWTAWIEAARGRQVERTSATSGECGVRVSATTKKQRTTIANFDNGWIMDAFDPRGFETNSIESKLATIAYETGRSKCIVCQTMLQTAPQVALVLYAHDTDQESKYKNIHLVRIVCTQCVSEPPPDIKARLTDWFYDYDFVVKKSEGVVNADGLCC
jgi:hypothetical protein